jgi:hypothetical protein
VFNKVNNAIHPSSTGLLSLLHHAADLRLDSESPMAVNNSSHRNNGLRRRDSKDPHAPTTTRTFSLADSQAPSRTDAWLIVECLFYKIKHLTHHDPLQSMDINEFDDLNGPPQDLPRGNRRPDPEGDEGSIFFFSRRDPIDAGSRISMSIGGSRTQGGQSVDLVFRAPAEEPTKGKTLLTVSSMSMKEKEARTASSA